MTTTFVYMYIRSWFARDDSTKGYGEVLMYMCICVYAYIYIYAYTHIYTYTYIYT